MSPEKKFVLAILMLPGLFSSAIAQQAKKASGTIPVMVNVLDLHGNAIRDLTKNDFRIRINGNPVVVTEAQYNVASRRVVIVLDMSGSMAPEMDAGKSQTARQVVDDFLTLPSDSAVAMVTFSDHIYQIFDFSQGRNAIARWLKDDSQANIIKHGGKTALFDAILAGLKLLEPFQLGDAVYAITDGEENHSQSSKRPTEAILLNSRVRLFAFLFGDPTPVSEEQEAKESFLRMVGDSGGLVVGFFGRQVLGGPSWKVQYDYDQHSQQAIRAFTQQLSNQVKAFWILQLQVPSQSKKSKVKLEIVDQRGKARKDLAFSYPRVLPPTN